MSHYALKSKTMSRPQALTPTSCPVAASRHAFALAAGKLEDGAFACECCSLGFRVHSRDEVLVPSSWFLFSGYDLV